METKYLTHPYCCGKSSKTKKKCSFLWIYSSIFFFLSSLLFLLRVRAHVDHTPCWMSLLRKYFGCHHLVRRYQNIRVFFRSKTVVFSFFFLKKKKKCSFFVVKFLLSLSRALCGKYAILNVSSPQQVNFLKILRPSPSLCNTWRFFFFCYLSKSVSAHKNRGLRSPTCKINTFRPIALFTSKAFCRFLRSSHCSAGSLITCTLTCTRRIYRPFHRLFVGHTRWNFFSSPW